jgi:hypothetical protein
MDSNFSGTAAREPIAILRRACPTHARLGEKDGQRGAHPYVFYRLGVDWSSPENRVHDEATDLEFELDRGGLDLARERAPEGLDAGLARFCLPA